MGGYTAHTRLVFNWPIFQKFPELFQLGWLGQDQK